MRFSVKKDGGPLAWPPTDVDLANVVIIDMNQPIGPQAAHAAIVPRPGLDLRRRSTLIAAALTAIAFGLAALSYLA